VIRRAGDGAASGFSQPPRAGGNKIFGTFSYLKRLRKMRGRTGIARFSARPRHARRPMKRSSRGAGRIWHMDCIMRTMTDESYVSLLLWTICVLMFACGVVAVTEHPNWFGA
jgi:hypothetical protein